MTFKIESFDKLTDLYLVVSDTGEQKYVTGIQIVQVMINGYKFINAKLTGKGFAIITNKGTRYVQVNGLPKQMQITMHNIVAAENKAAEIKKEQKEQKEQKVIKPIPKVKAKAVTPKSDSTKSEKPKAFTFRGERFLSERQLCKKFNRDIDTFKTMIAKGYNIEESLGLCKPRSDKELEQALEERKRTFKTLDSMAVARGDF